jgi:hypothetical protein
MKLFKRPRILIAGPWLSELGWELMVWQAAVRYQRITKKYNQVYVITFKNRECLYEDCKVFTHDQQLINADFGVGRVDKTTLETLTQACVDYFSIKETFDQFSPNTYCSLPYRIAHKFKRGLIHRKFHEPPLDKRRFDIVFHFREFERKDETATKYFSTETADRLVALCKAKGLEVCCIGAPGYSYVAKGAENRQSIDLSQTIATMCASRLVVGGSSAPMHLASLCELPIVVWTGPPFNAERYFTYANPFNSKVFLVTEKSFNPRVEDIFDTINQALEQL